MSLSLATRVSTMSDMAHNVADVSYHSWSTSLLTMLTVLMACYAFGELILVPVAAWGMRPVSVQPTPRKSTRSTKNRIDFEAIANSALEEDLKGDVART